MKRIFIALVIGLITVSAFSQNFQLHYDLGEDREYVTSTFEMFKPDQWGSTFIFVDFDYNVGDVEGVSLAYMEIARALKFWDSPFAAQVEYNGGFGQWAPGMAFQVHDAWLTGGQYTWNNADYSQIFTLQGLYKYINDGVNDVSFQVTGVWAIQLFGGKATFSGFADFWKEEKEALGTDFVFLAEPQIWYNATKNLSLGSEIELSNNFINEGFKVCPTLAMKWNF
jgi:hypothetical protein